MRSVRMLLALALLLSLFAGSLWSGTAAAQTANVQAVVDPLLRSALQSKPTVEAIVTFRGTDAPTASDVAVLKQLGITTGVTLRSLPMAGVILTKAQAEALAAKPEVRSIYLNKQLEFINYEATALTGVDKVRTDSNMTTKNGGLPVSGKGVTVLVNDSGVDGTHEDLKLGRNLVQNVMASANLNALEPSLLPITYVENVPNTDTSSGHGTHVAGTVGGTGARSNGKYEGVAPGANLVGYGSGAALFVLDGIGGFDYAITNQSRYEIRVITNSWGSSGDFDPNDPINIASKRAFDRGITVLFAAGNEGPGEDTHNPYATAPWVISVGAGDKDGKLADFSSRGTKGKGGTFTIDGQQWQWEDRPTIAAPGVDIISTRAVAPVSSLNPDLDASLIEPAYLPYYTVMSGTSMATPHVAGIVALMLDANPQLNPATIKDILQKTATNMPGYESWEAGVGYVNAYAAVDRAFNERAYGKTVNAFRAFNSNATVTATRQPFTVDYNPVTLASTNRTNFTVGSGVAELSAKINAYGLLEETGNPLNLVLIAPDGTEYSSGVSLLFPLYTDRVVSVTNPVAGNWQVELRGLRGDPANPIGVGLPETVNGTLTFKKSSGFTGLNDIAGHAAEAAIKLGVGERLVDGYSDGTFKPNNALKRKELAQFLVMGAEIRQSLPASKSFSDVSSSDLPFVEAVAAKGAAFRDKLQQQRGVMRPVSGTSFKPDNAVLRADLAYSLVQSLGFEKEAQALNGKRVTVLYGDQRIPIDDAAQIPAGLEGYVQLALDLNIINAYFTLQQGPTDLQPTIHATFKPTQQVPRGEAAVALTRFYSAFLAP